MTGEDEDKDIIIMGGPKRDDIMEIHYIKPKKKIPKNWEKMKMRALKRMIESLE